MADFGGYGGGGSWGTPTGTSGPQPPEHVRVTWSGGLGPAASPYEIWAMGLSVSLGAAAPTKAAMVTFAAACRDSFSTNIAPILSSQVGLERTRVARIGSNGLTDRNDDGSYAQVDDVPSVAVRGGSGAVALPQVALVITCDTGSPGQTGRGRFFLPMINLGGNDLAVGGMTAAMQSSAKNAAVAFINGVNTAAGTAGLGTVCVASAGSVKHGIQPRLRRVTAIRVGRTYDTMRSRRNRLDEEYVSAAVA